MPREVVVLQVGQCGNQIGCRFWDLMLREHIAETAAAATSSRPSRDWAKEIMIRKPISTFCNEKESDRFQFDDAMSSFFFHNPDTRFSWASCDRLPKFKARAVLVDMEEGVLKQLLSGPLGKLFDEKQLIADVSGAGNNWAHGYAVYGPQYRERLEDGMRRALELAETPQAFLLLHSLGGGTGSGVGAYMLEMAEDLFPQQSRLCCSVAPSPTADDDVVTSPYNSLLALNWLQRHASCVLPVSNDALLRIATQAAAESSTSSNTQRKVHFFDEMNDVVAQMLSNLTSSMRFDGSLNVDIGDLTTNLVPYPRLHFLLSSLISLKEQNCVVQQHHQPQQVQIGKQFATLLRPGNQLLRSSPTRSLCLASAFILRGSGIAITDVLNGVARLRKQLKFMRCIEDATKLGVCRVPPRGCRYGLLGLFNSCEVGHFVATIRQRFLKLYRRKAHLHHYQQYLEMTFFEEASESLLSLSEEYSNLNAGVVPSPKLAREAVGKNNSRLSHSTAAVAASSIGSSIFVNPHSCRHAAAASGTSGKHSSNFSQILYESRPFI